MTLPLRVRAGTKGEHKAFNQIQLHVEGESVQKS